MKQNEELLSLLEILMKIDKRGKYTVLFEFSGNVKFLCIRIFEGKWSEKKKPVFDKTLKIWDTIGVLSVYEDRFILIKDVVSELQQKFDV